MTYKWIGAILIIASCGGTGFSIAAASKKEEFQLHQMICAMQYMKSELRFRLTPLPQLCRQTGKQCAGTVRRLFEALAGELENQLLPEASDCMRAALNSIPDFPGSLRSVCLRLGASLGQLDLDGQLQGLDQAFLTCRHIQKQLESNKEQRLRSYQTLGLCAGAALAILLM